MTIRILGVLPDPFGAPCPKAIIRFTALSNEGSVLKGTDAEELTDKNGNYDFPLEQGRYLLEVQYSDELMESGSVLVDEATPSTLNLSELIRYTSPFTPPLVDNSPTEWAILFQEVISNDEWDRQSENQVRDEDILVNEDKSIHKDKDSYLTKETVTNSTGSSQSVQQTLNYKDATGREAGYNKREITTDLVSTGSGEEAYSDVDTYEAKQFSLLEGAESASKQERTITDSTAQDAQEFRVGDNTTTSTKTVTGSSVDVKETVDTSTAQITSRKYVDANDLVSALLEQGVIVENVEAFDRLTVSSTGSKRDIQVDEFNVGNTLKVDTVNDVVTVAGEFKLVNGDDYKGPVGDSQYLEYAYATAEGKDLNEWHIDDPDDPYDLPEGTVWRKHRTVLVKDGETSYGSWSNPYLLTGEDGREGDTLYWDYKYNQTADLPDPSAINPIGWEDSLKDGHLYRIERLVSNGVYQGVWSTPAKIAGADGDNGELVFEEYMYSPYGTTTPETNPEHWHTNFSSGDFFRSSRLIKYAAGTPVPIPNGTEPIMVTNWTTPALITPRKGFEYADGLSQIVVHLYIRSTSSPALPTEVLTYNFDTLALTGNMAGWSTSIPEGTGNLWMTIATASSNTGTDDIAPNEWIDPQLSNTQAYNQATISLYKRSPIDVVPTAPSTNLSYNFTSGELTGDLEGWSDGTIPAGTEDLYIATSSVRSQANTAEIAPEFWGVGILTSSAFRQQTVNIYRRGGSTRPSADVTYNFTDGTVTGLDPNWSLDIPEGETDVFIGIAVASASGITDVINPEDWSIGPLGTSGHQAVVLNLYQSSVTKPPEPAVEITYDFTQGKIISDTGLWFTEVPENSQGKIYVTTATANASALAKTDVIPIGEWTDPQVILESGINAVSVMLYCKHDLGSAPEKHTNALTYSFSNAALINTPDNNWQSYPMSVSLGEGVWSVVATASGLASNPTDVIQPSEFSDPVIYTASGSEVYTVFRYAEHSTGPWYDEFTVERVWRIQATYVNGTTSDWSDPMKLTGEDGAVGDTLYVAYLYSDNLSDWHEVFAEGDIWRKEAIVTNGVYGEWSSPARLKGNEEFIEYQYAAVLHDELAWHSNFSTGDHYRRERSVVNGVMGEWSEGAQIVPLKDVDYSDGTGGDTIYEVYQYSIDGLTDWEYDFTDAHIYRRTAVAINGAVGPWSEPAKLSGIDGAAGDTIYMEYEYSADALDWHTAMQDGDVWRHEREHTVGVTVPTDPWGNRTRIRGVDGAFYEYLYNEDNDNYPTEPDDVYGTWHTNFSEGDYYRIERLVQETSVGNWTLPTKLKPKKGEDYNDGIEGPKGEDGVTTYTWLKYADDDTGSNMEDSPVGKPYMGLAYNKLTEEESTNPNDYSWSKVEGDKGVQGENGYMWVQYSNHDDGMDGTTPAMHQDPINEATGRPYPFIGIAYNQIDINEGSDPTVYTWSKYIGDEIYYEYSYSPDLVEWDMTIDANDIWRRERRVENGQYGNWSEAIRIVGTEGPQGVEGEKGKDGNPTYTWIRYADDDIGNGLSNNPTNKKYMGMAYNKDTPTESSNKNDYVWSLIQGADGADGLNGADGVDGLDGVQGIQGPAGDSGKTSFFHTAYADTASGGGFSQDPVGKDYIGTYSDFSATDSNNPAKYTWVLVKGAQGTDGTNGIAGENGENGETSYLHIAYAENENGGYMSQDPSGKDYIGQYVDFELKDSNDPSKYTWAKMKGDQGVEGPVGPDGEPTYTWIKYSPNSDGSVMTDSPEENTKYLGISPNQKSINESDNPLDYTWSLYIGANGQYYSDEFSVTGDPSDEEAWHYPAFSKDKFKRTRLIDSEGEPVIDETTDASGWVYTQISPIKDVDYGDGNSGDTIFEIYEYSIDGMTNWHSDFSDEDIYRRTATVINGSLGPWSEVGKLSGEDGADGDTIWVKHQYSVTTATWHDTFEDGDVWRRDATVINGVVGTWSNPARIRGENGLNGTDGIDGVSGSDGQTSYFHTAYADSSDGSGFSQDPTGKDYIGTYADFTLADSNNPADYVWVLIKGAQGADGTDGIAGENGEDGQTTYLHIAYADTSTGSGFSQDPENKAYIGQYVDFTLEDSSDPSKYTWALIKGADGNDGINGADGVNGLDGKDGIAGTDGEDGRTSYFHTAYADSADGDGFSQSPVDKHYIGTYADFTQEDSNNPSDYTWVLSKGAQGEDGTDGIAGENGIDGKTSYLHIAYADDASGNGFNQSPVDKMYIGQYTDFTQADSTDPSKYTWALIKGADGDYLEYEYSINGVDDWHSNFLSGDYYQRTRIVTPPNTYGEWTVKQVVPLKDVDYGDGNGGDTIYEVYQYSTDGVSGWEDIFKDEHNFRRTAVVVNGSQSEWSDGARISGKNGLQTNVITLFQVKEQRYTWLPQELVQGEITYLILTGSFVGYDSEEGINGWKISVPDVLNAGEALYQIRVAALSEAGQLEVPIPVDDWALPVQVSASGVSGTDGKHGSGSYVMNWEDIYNEGNGYNDLITSITPPILEGYVEYWFQEVSGRASQAGDMLTIQQAEVEDSVPAQWMRNTTEWEKFVFSIDGSAVVNGTLAAESLKSGTAITDTLYISNSGSKAEMTLSGSGEWMDKSGNPSQSNYRMWVGEISPTEAPYSVKYNGETYLSKLIAESAVIKGHIEADSGYFQGAIDTKSLTASENINIGGDASSRLKLTDDRLDVYENGILRVRIGRL